jgi:zinc protease
VLSVVGDVDTRRVIALAEEYYGGLDGEPVPRERGPDEPEQRVFRYRRVDGEITSAYLEWGWPTQGILHPDTAALDVLAITLGQGRASRLYQAVRDAGHAQSVDVQHYTPGELGLFNLSIETTAERVQHALVAAAQVLGSAAGEWTEPELERARNLVRARLLRRMESVEGQASMLADWQALGDWRLALDHHKRVLGVDAGALRDVAARYLAPERTSLLAYAPAGAQLPADVESVRELLDTARTPRAVAPRETAVARANVTSGSATLESEEDGVRFYRSVGGARIVVLPRPGSGLVALAIAAPGGSCMETEQRAGLTGLVARAALKGTASFTAAQLAECTESLGGSIGTSVGADEFAWTLSLPARHLAEGVRLLAEAALRPVFPVDELERERENLLAQLQQTRDDMHRYPLRLCLAAAFPHHPYGFPLDVQEASLQALTRDDVLDWHGQLVHASAPWFFVVGDVDADAAARACAAQLDQARSGVEAREQCASPALWPNSPARAAVHQPRHQTALALAFPGPRRNELDADALRLLGSAVGGLGGRLFEELRSRRSLAYTVSVAPLARVHGGAFLAYIATSPEREEEARDALLAELGSLRSDPIEDQDVERAKRFSIGARRIRRQTNAAQLGDLVDALLLGRGLAELRDYERRIDALDGEILCAAAARWLDPARVVEGVVRGEELEAAARQTA